MLQSFTQFEVRSLEQILLTQIRPQLNSNYTVVFPYSNKEKSAYIMYEGSKPLEVRVGDNPAKEFLMKFSSKNSYKKRKKK